MRCTQIPASCLYSLEEFIPDFLEQYYKYQAFPRHEGAGRNLIKNHLFLHLVWDTKWLGSPENF